MRKRIYRTALIMLLLPLMFCGCKTTDKTGPVQYEYLLVERQGGGQLDFRVYPGESRSHLYIYVSSSDFQPVEKRFQLQIDESNVDAFDDYYKALSGQLPLKGKLKATGKLKGTWLDLRFVRGNRETEITNPELIQRFTVFENLVRNQIGQK
jgi:hypothetical protein